MVHAGSAKNVIPSSGEAAGTLRMLDAVAWADAEDLVRELIAQILAPYGVQAEVTYVRGVPPVVNKAGATALLGRAVSDVLGKEGVVSTPQSLGGEDFAWYLESLPGAMGRLGTRTPGRRDLRPAPGRPGDRRAGHRDRGQGAGGRRADHVRLLVGRLSARLPTEPVTKPGRRPPAGCRRQPERSMVWLVCARTAGARVEEESCVV